MADRETIFVTASQLPRLDAAKLMLEAQKRFGASVTRQTLEMVRLQRGRSALSAYEYYYYSLFDPGRSWEQKLEYAGQERARSIFLLANQFTWWDAAEDKLAFHAAMQAQGYPSPALLALAHPERTFGGVPNLRSRTELIDWLKAAPTPLFGKPVNANHGVGALLIAQVDAQGSTFTTDGGRTHRLEDLADEVQPFVARGGYLFQEAIRPHPDVAAITGGRLATLRIVILRGPAGPEVFHVICRLPAGPNRVDNFRRAGNLIAPVDPATGQLGPVMRGVSLQREVLGAHPDTGAVFEGYALPLVREAAALALDAGAGFPGLHIQSWDVALAADGVRAIEMNPGGNLNLVQLSNDRGVMTPEFQEFVRWCAGLELNTQIRGRELALKRAA